MCSVATRLEVIPTTTTAQRPPVTEIEYDAPVLMIKKGRSIDLYTVTEFVCGFDGRAFEVRKDSTGEVYNVYLARNGQDSFCDCAGCTYTSNSPIGGHCRHLDSLQRLMVEGLLEDPEAGRPVEPFPSAQQIADDAQRDPWAADTVVTLTEAGIRATDPVEAMAVSPF